MKGIILAGGTGSRLYPSTISVSKQLIPIYDKPMIYYPLSVLLMAGIKDILLITNTECVEQYKKLLGDGSKIGINIGYKAQEKPRGIAEAFILGEDFIGDDEVCLILGDNIFHGQGFQDCIDMAIAKKGKARIFGYPVTNPKSFGVVEFDENNKVLSIEEKPENPKSNYAVPGLYFYDSSVVEKAKTVKPSDRGELEISTINSMYLEDGNLDVVLLGRGLAWLDTGTPRGLLQASDFVSIVQERQGLYIACIEEIAWRNGWINDEQLRSLGENLKKTDYGKYLLNLLAFGDKKRRKNK